MLHRLYILAIDVEQNYVLSVRRAKPPASNTSAKRNAAALVILHREDTDVVYLRIDASRRAAGDRDLEFARQIREVAIADKEIVHPPNQRRHVVKLIRVDSRNRTTDYV